MNKNCELNEQRLKAMKQRKELAHRPELKKRLLNPDGFVSWITKSIKFLKR